MTRLDRLRCALKYSSGAEHTAIRAMILEIECGFTENDCPGSDTDGEAGPQNPAPAVRSDSRSGPEGGSVNVGEPDTREPPQSPSAPQAEAVKVTAGRDQQPSPTEDRLCAICGDVLVRGILETSRGFLRRRSCGLNTACFRSRDASRKRRQHARRGSIRGAQANAALSARARAVDVPASTPTIEQSAERTRACELEGCPNRILSRSQNKYCSATCIDEARDRRQGVTEHRQPPPGPPTYRLTWNPQVRIAPDRPARRTAMFWDDLNAIADHGSPLALMP